MQLIERTTLLYQEGNSDKIYEVDLCQTGQDLYVVNFRYGRRGINLKEGVKTAQAVPEAQARKVFNQLVASKVKKGYRDVTTQASNDTSAPQSIDAANAPVVNNSRYQAILNRLANRDNNKWPMDRAIWRAGELKIREATPLLIQLVGTGEPLRDYCIAWALGWCGDESAIASLRDFLDNASTPEFVQRIAFEALLKLSDEATRVGLRSQKLDQLPTDLRDQTRNDSTDFSNALRAYLDTIYQIDNEQIRPVLLDILRTAPLKPNNFQQLRHIFKIAEYRHDAEVFGILTYRFARESAMYRSNQYFLQLPDGTSLRAHYSHYNEATRSYERVETNEFQAEIQHPDARLAYSTKTRAYLIRRVWRTLKQLGEEGDPDYVNMAEGILLQYSDADAVPVKHSRFGRYNWKTHQYHYNNVDWDSYAGYLTFNHCE